MKMKIRIFLILLSLTISSSLLARGRSTPATQASPADSGNWGYQGEGGPAHWGSLGPTFALCEDGRQQSPVDIQGVRPAELPHLSFSFRSSSLSIHSRPNTLSLDYEPDSFLYIGKRRYRLFGIDFHTPGEHRFRGRSTVMEIHLKYTDTKGDRLVVGVPVSVGRHNNSMLRRIGNYLPQRGEPDIYEHRVGINATFLLPTKREYFSYAGSMTRPPCDEGVRWIVMKKPVTISDAYLERFRRAIGSNARPVQPMNGRQILSAGS